LSNNRKRALIFDFGGVLMKTTDYRPRHAWDERLGLPHGSVEKIVHGSLSWRQAQHGQIAVETYWDDVAQQLNLEKPALRQLQTDFFAGDQLDAALIDYIRQRRAEGFTVGLLSNDSPMLREKLSSLEIHDLFDPLVISAEIGVMKPDPAAYRAVLERLNRPPDEMIFIDDLPENIAAARLIGIRGVHYTVDMDLPSVLETLF
jgi:epoxide hydrolase-like predicted phosphatase